MDCNFYVGQRVICVDASSDDPKRPDAMRPLEEGATYTIRWLRPAQLKDSTATVFLGLTEIVRKQNALGVEAGYRYTRFKPATDISDLEKFLKAPPVRVREPENA